MATPMVASMLSELASVEGVVFIVGAVIAIAGSIGVIRSKHPVHAALNLVMTLFAVAVLLLNQDAQFLAAVQVIVYAGAIVVLFLFVIMLLGVDSVSDMKTDPIIGQRFLAIVLGVAVLILAVIPIALADEPTGFAAVQGAKVDSITNSFQESAVEALPDDQTSGVEVNPNIDQLGRQVFTNYVYAFEITSLLLTIAVVGAVVMARRPKGELQPLPAPASVFPDEETVTLDAASGEE